MCLKSKLRLYRTFKDQYSVATYCNINLTRAQKALVAKIRLGIFPINVETGRYSGKPSHERKYLKCQDDLVEDEMHLLFKCKAYEQFWTNLFAQALNIDLAFNRLSNKRKLSFLVNQKNIIRTLSNFLKHVLLSRQIN